MAEQTVDPWIDEEFGTVDFRTYREDKELEPDTSTEMIQPDFGQVTAPAEVISNVPLAPEPEAIVEVEPEGPEVIELEGGGTVIIEKTKSKGWKASLDVGIGGVQNFKGQTKDALLGEVLKAQAHATRKIRDLNKQVKFGTGRDSSSAPAAPSIAQPKQLSADEIFQIKTKLESNPVEALDEWYKLRTGRDVTVVAERSDKGYEASQALSSEAVNNSFREQHPEFYPDPEYKNFTSLVSLLAKQHLDKTVTTKNQEAIFNRLQADGHWTVQNLDEAFEELSEAGLLLTWPRRQEAPTPEPPAPVAPAPLSADPRIVSRVVQPRAGLGLRQSEATPVRPEAPKPPSVDDLDQLSDTQIKELLEASIRLKRQQGRR